MMVLIMDILIVELMYSFFCIAYLYYNFFQFKVLQLSNPHWCTLLTHSPVSTLCHSLNKPPWRNMYGQARNRGILHTPRLLGQLIFHGQERRRSATMHWLQRIEPGLIEDYLTVRYPCPLPHVHATLEQLTEARFVSGLGTNGRRPLAWPQDTTSTG